ncbi:MAG: hypothetical protein Tsb0020_02040 [Haliangiales bacterium]
MNCTKMGAYGAPLTGSSRTPHAAAQDRLAAAPRYGPNLAATGRCAVPGRERAGSACTAPRLHEQHRSRKEQTTNKTY